MLPFRKEIEDLEVKLDCILDNQLKSHDLLVPLQANLERAQGEEANLLKSAVEDKFESHRTWLDRAFGGFYKSVLTDLAKQRTDTLTAIETLATLNQEQISLLQKQVLDRLDSLEAQNRATAEQIKEFKRDWQGTVDCEIRDESSESLDQWCDEVAEKLTTFISSEGMPRAFALQLFQSMKKLRTLSAELGDTKANFASRLEELQRVLFSVEGGLSWNSLTPRNSTPAQRKSLRSLETAVAEYRSHLQEKLRRTTGIALLEIVPFITKFDAKQHESNEFLEVPTSEEARHNLILSVERPGFQKIVPHGPPTLLQTARVRRFVLEQKVDPVALIPDLDEPILPIATENGANAQETAREIPSNVTSDASSVPNVPGDDLSHEDGAFESTMDEDATDVPIADAPVADVPVADISAQDDETTESDRPRVRGQL